jgi:RNA polymerase sigma factor (sigma-70 family)
MTPPPDLDVHLPGIVAGDPEAFARWVAGAEPVLREALRPFARRVDVEATLQEALLRVWQVAPRFVPDGRPHGLLRLGHRIAKNAALSELRRRHPQPTLPEILEAEAEPISPPLPDPALRRAIHHCLERLPDKPSAVLHARIDSLGVEPDRDLAERLGMRLNTFLQNFTRARKLLLECLGARGISVDGGVE